jgi:hypothetical protein
MENQITKFISKLGSSDFRSWIKVQEAYLSNCFGEEIMEVGFNNMSGYVYIALENGVQIASCFGQDVEFIVTDYEDGEETFCETYYQALKQLGHINQ